MRGEGQTLNQELVRKVRQATENTVPPECKLWTPDQHKGVEFIVDSIGADGIRVNKIPQTPIRWEELADVVAWLKHRGATIGESGYTVNVGSVQGNNAVADTLEWRLRAFTRVTTMKSSYVAPILDRAGIVTVDGSRRPNKVTLTVNWR